MSSVYDNIKTPKDLVYEVMLHGFSTKEEDVVRAQDILANAPIEDLVFLANDVGRNNENGLPDPKGTYSSGRRGTRDTFYQILFNIWNYEDAVRFWNEHTNPEHEQLRNLEQELEEFKQACQNWIDQTQQEREKRIAETEEKVKYMDKVYMLHTEISELEAEIRSRDLKIIELKAKLYDLMIEDGE